MIVLEIILLSAAMLVALFYFGWGITRLVLPPTFSPYRIPLTPFVGMALVIVWDYLALFFGLNLTLATWTLVAAATLLNGFALVPNNMKLRGQDLRGFRKPRRS